MFDDGIYNILNGAIDLDTDTFKVALSNTAPDAAADDEFGDITEISAGFGYSAGGQTVDNVSLAESGGGTGVWIWTFDDETFTASGGSIGPFRYVIIYSDTSTGDKLVGYLDYGTAITLTDGNSFSADTTAGTGVIQFAEA
jgi:hypothetical protein